jgi:hypothetical protein
MIDSVDQPGAEWRVDPQDGLRETKFSNPGTKHASNENLVDRIDRMKHLKHRQQDRQRRNKKPLFDLPRSVEKTEESSGIAWKNVDAEKMYGRFDVQHTVSVLGKHFHEPLLSRPQAIPILR